MEGIVNKCAVFGNKRAFLADKCAGKSSYLYGRSLKHIIFYLFLKALICTAVSDLI
jgi:hypothetical protein